MEPSSEYLKPVLRQGSSQVEPSSPCKHTPAPPPPQHSNTNHYPSPTLVVISGFPTCFRQASKSCRTTEVSLPNSSRSSLLRFWPRRRERLLIYKVCDQHQKKSHLVARTSSGRTIRMSNNTEIVEISRLNLPVVITPNQISTSWRALFTHLSIKSTTTVPHPDICRARSANAMANWPWKTNHHTPTDWMGGYLPGEWSGWVHHEAVPSDSLMNLLSPAIHIHHTL